MSHSVDLHRENTRQHKASNVKNLFFTWGIPFAVTSSYVFLSFQQDLRLSVHALIGASALAVCSLAVLLYAGEHDKVRLSAGAIIILALFFRLLFLFRPPELSDDVYRYLWDGLQTLRGTNPYGLAPALVKPLDAASAVLQQKINHPQFVTIYPPMSQIVFALGAAVSRSLIGLKITLVIFDMTACFIILKLLYAMELPAWRAALYAWHPLPVIEIAGSGHIDGVGILFFLVTLSILFSKSHPDLFTAGPRSLDPLRQKGNSFIAGVLFTASVSIKFIPLVYFPVLLAAAAYPLGMVSGFLAGLALLWVPFFQDLSHIFTTLTIYLQNWEFANFAFRILRNLTSSGDNARMILASLFMICVLFFTVSFRISRIGSVRGKSFPLLIKALYGITFGFLLFTPMLHPWYVLYIVGFFPFIVGPAGLVFSWAVFLSYHVLIEYAVLGRWIENDMSVAAVWFSPAVAWLASYIIKAFRPSPSK
jgi:hypothetical protein